MKQTVHPRGGWQQEENDLLFAAVRDAAAEGRPLRDVFARVGEELHRKPNSIRNYYYAKVKDEPQLAPSKVTFRAFDQEELHQLLRDVLMAKGRGESVRACVIRQRVSCWCRRRQRPATCRQECNWRYGIRTDRGWRKTPKRQERRRWQRLFPLHK